MNGKKLLVLFIASLAFLPAFAQQGKISGSILSASTKDAVAGAVIILTNADSSFRHSVITDESGRFYFNNVSPGFYNLLISAVGFETRTHPLTNISSKNKVLIDSIFLNPFFDTLQTVIVSAKRPSVNIKTDTTEFSASAFKVRKNATVEDMFQKMPGLEVDKNGGIKAQGETVTQIYVDGKPFFGTDLKSVTQNFPADIIDKIQIIDKRSDQALATKVEDGVREKIINITLKKDRKKGMFGKDYIGYGTENRYEGKLNTNIFNNERKISVIVAANNTNRNDNNNPGADDASYDNRNGITNTTQAKINYADKFGKNFDFSTYLNFEKNNNKRDEIFNRENIFGDSSSFYYENRKSRTITQSYNAGLYFEYRPDTLTFIRVNENAGYNINDFDLISAFNSTLADNAKLNDGNRLSNRRSKAPFANGQVSINRKLKKAGRNFFFNFNNNINNNLTDNFNISNNYFYPVDGNYYSQLLNQLQNNNNNSYTLGSSVSYTEPLGKNSSLNFSYNYRYAKNNTIKEAFDYNIITSLYDLFNDTLSNRFDNNNYNGTAGVTYNYGTSKFGFGAGLRRQDALVKSRSLTTDSIYDQNFSGIYPNLNLFINGKGKRFNLYYNFNLQAPQAFQLQPVVDNTNPLFLKLGNPELKFASVHNIRYNFNTYNAKKQTGFNSNAGIALINNNIANSNTFDNNTGSQVSVPINVDGAYNWNTWFSYFRPLAIHSNKIKWNISLFANGFKNINILNSEKNITLNDYERISTGFIYDAPEWIDVRFNVGLSRQRTIYSLESTLNNTSNFLEINPNVTFIPASGTEINIDYNYRQTTGQSADFNTTINMLNADVVQYLSKKKNVWVRLKAYDILQQNVSIWRSAGDNYIQDTKANVLSNFYLLSFNIRLNKFNHKLPEYPGSQSSPGDL